MISFLRWVFLICAFFVSSGFAMQLGLGRAVILDKIFHSDANMRKTAIRSFPVSYLKDKEYVNILSRVLLEDSVVAVRREVMLLLLGQIKKIPRTKELLHVISTSAEVDLDTRVRSLAVQVVAGFHSKVKDLQTMQTATLLKSLSDKDSDVRFWATWGLGQNSHVATDILVRQKLIHVARYDVDFRVKEMADTAFVQLTGGSSVRPLCDRVFSK